VGYNVNICKYNSVCLFEVEEKVSTEIGGQKHEKWGARVDLIRPICVFLTLMCIVLPLENLKILKIQNSKEE
jgi:hypothetical protein